MPPGPSGSKPDNEILTLALRGHFSYLQQGYCQFLLHRAAMTAMTTRGRMPICMLSQTSPGPGGCALEGVFTLGDDAAANNFPSRTILSQSNALFLFR